MYVEIHTLIILCDIIRGIKVHSFSREGKMAAQQQSSWRKMSYEEYLTLHQTDPSAKWEYIKGYAVMMTGGTFSHSRVGGQLFALLNAEFQEGPCYVCNSDMAVRVAEDITYVPDCSISCDVSDAQSENLVLQHPYLVAEVLSPSTELKDRMTKLRLYQAHPTIEEILLINTRHQEIEVYQCDPEDHTTWKHHRYFPGQEVQLNILDITLPVDAVYRRSKVPILAPPFVEDMPEEES